ncbi:unnamed protein product [marine sediment metagenome]|uniref:Uncharacterized protein n=1 Tax=marine sediment metagenome TaxID=412755 RepID=X0WEU2_9ZZZZ
MRLARSRAVAERTYYLGVFDSNPDSEGRCHIWVQKDETYSSKDPVFGTEKVLPKGVVIDSTTTGGGGGPIYSYVFTLKGAITVGSTGTIYLRDAGSHTKYSVNMRPATGDIHMKDSW